MVPTSIAKKRVSAPDVDSAEAIFRRAKRQPAQMTIEQVEEAETEMLDPQTHFWRRAGMGSLAMSGPELFGKIAKDRESALVFAELAIGIRAYAKRMEAMVALLHSAQMRIELALCVRPDCSKVKAEADRARAETRAEVEREAKTRHG